MKLSGKATDHLYFADNFNIEKARHLYKLLKRDLYYENVNIYDRLAISEFEIDQLEQKLTGFLQVINSAKPETIKTFRAWLRAIDFRLLAKKITLPADVQNQDSSDNGKAFISNLRTASKYFLEEVNYFADVPVQLLLLSMLWSVTVGVLLDKKISRDCLGNRLNLRTDEGFDQNSYTAFRYYLSSYNKWRNTALKTGLKNLAAGNDVLLMALDIKQCYYFLKTNWDEIYNAIDKSRISKGEKEFCKKITTLLSIVHLQYLTKAEAYLKVTHYQAKEIHPDQYVGLPIGLPSSRILANWELSPLDKAIKRKLRPIYYGRYVDDFLIVLNNPGRERLTPSKIIDDYFIKTGILGNGADKSVASNSQTYKILSSGKYNARYEFLEIQRKKLIFHFYAHEGSWAGLSEFKKELHKQASEFRFLPVKGELNEFMDDAYDINFEGSKNKLRSVIGVKENSVKLSNQLYARLLKYWLGNRKLEKKELEKLMRFYQGRNIFEYARTWERVFTLFVGTNQLQQCVKYYRDIQRVISRLRPYTVNRDQQKVAPIRDANIIKKTRSDLVDYLSISLSFALSFESAKNRKEIRNKNGWLAPRIFNWAVSLRTAHMVRHELVRWPLLEYASLDANLISFDVRTGDKRQKWNWDQSSFEYAPRFIYYHEFALLRFLKGLLVSNELVGTIDTVEQYLTIPQVNGTPKIEIDEEGNNIIRVFDASSRTKRRFSLGVANIEVLEENVKSSYKPNSRPNLSLKRQDDLFQVINEAIRYPSCDLVVLPEVSIPYMWLPFMANTSRKNRVGLVFGLEHVVVNNIAYNFVVTILPFQSDKSRENCFISIRIKNHYSPEEAIDLKKYGYKLPKSHLYEKFFWRDCWFSVYNCFELTDIYARGLFRAELDLLVSIVWNQDVNYYSNIIEATSRDLHLYIVQANTSKHGDSRIVAPKRTEEKDIIRVKGGINPVLLKDFININELRDFQNHLYDQKDKRFKPTPAGFEHDKARKKSK